MIDVLQTLRSFDGNSLKTQGPGGEPSDLTLRFACVNALIAPDNEASVEQKTHRYLLAQKLSTKNEVELSGEEVDLVLELVSKAYPSPMVVGRIFEILKNGD